MLRKVLKTWEDTGLLCGSQCFVISTGAPGRISNVAFLGKQTFSTWKIGALQSSKTKVIYK